MPYQTHFRGSPLLVVRIEHRIMFFAKASLVLIYLMLKAILSWCDIAAGIAAKRHANAPSVSILH
jgi:hypothetical protein